MTDNIEEFFDVSKMSGVTRRIRRPRRKTPKNDLEGSVVKECRLWLKNHGYYHERRNTGAIAVEGRFVQFGETGAADIFAVIHGQHVEIECKRRDGKGRLSDDQKDFRQLMSDYCIPYFVVTSAEELERCVGAWRLHQTR